MGDIVKYHGREICKDKNGKIVRAITRNQDKLLDAIEHNDVIFVSGPAGTGKSAVSAWYAISQLDLGVYDRIILTRPIMEAGESLGFLPGTVEEKVAPFMAPLYELIEKIKGKKITEEFAHKINTQEPPQTRYRAKKGAKPQPKKKLQSNEDFYKKVEVCPLAYMRGTTMSKSFVVVDEIQNLTEKNILLALSRIGSGTKMCLCGDIMQSDLDGTGTRSGFATMIKKLDGVPGITHVKFSVEDIVRSGVVKRILERLYGQHQYESEVYEHHPEDYDFSDDDITEDQDSGYYSDDELVDEDNLNPTDNPNDK